MPWRLGARELRARIVAGELSARDAVDACIARIEAVDDRLRAVPVRRFAAARHEAAALDASRATATPPGPLHGVPITVKESLDLRGTASTYGLPSRAEALAEADDVYVARLRAAGCVVLGKTNLSQCAAFLESENPLYGRTDNPWNRERAPGGSSGGQAAIVAAGGVPLGLGADIGGSCRNPAHSCGVVGFKPSEGLLPDMGRLSFAFGQRAVASQVGVIARDVADVALALELCASGPSPLDGETRRLGDAGAVATRGLRVAVIDSDGLLAPAAACARALSLAAGWLEAAGVELVRVPLPPLEAALALYVGLLFVDGGAGLVRALGRDRRDRRIKLMLLGAAASGLRLSASRRVLELSGRDLLAQTLAGYGDHSADRYFRLVEAQQAERAAWRRALEQAPGGAIAALLLPPSPLPAVRHGGTAELATMGAYAALANLLGWPAGVVPVTRVRGPEETATARGRDKMERAARASEQGSAGLPVGVQIMAPRGQDHVALALLALVERAARAAGEAPPLPVEP